MEALERRWPGMLLFFALLLRGAAGALAEDSEAVKRYAQNVARCMAALSKLAYCDLSPDVMHDALQESCGTPCSWAGFDLEPGSRLTAKDADGGGQLDFGFVAKFTRAEGINEASMAAEGCIVALKAPDDETTVTEVTAMKVPAAEDTSAPLLRRLTALLAAPAAPALGLTSASTAPSTRMEVWETESLCPSCQVAASYKRAWDGLKQRLADHLSDAGCNPGAAVYVTGHSKGAALATLAMFSLQAQMGYHVQLSYNFESPRVGNSAFAKAFDQLFCGPKGPLGKVALYRITHGNDRVVRQPSSKFGYTHVGQQVWYQKDDDSDFVVCGDATADPGCGLEGLNRTLTCPLLPSVACANKTCAEVCTEDAPRGGPHCRHPLAPAKSFCPSGGNKTENWGSEWNEVVRSGDQPVDWEKSCSWGKPAAPQTPPALPTSAPAGGAGAPATPSTTPRPAPGKRRHDHESPPPPPRKNTTCFAANVTYQPLDMPGHYFSVESDADACQTRCAGIEGCAYFSFFARGSSGDCHVAGLGAYRQKGSVGFVAGPRACAAAVAQDIDLLGGFTNYGPGSTLWYLPGVAAGCILATYFLCLAGLALSGDCAARGRGDYRQPLHALRRPAAQIGSDNVAAAL